METRFLPCKLSPDEIRKRGEKLASLRNQIADVEASKKEAMENFKSQITTLTKLADDITEEISTKAEWRSVEITEDKDFENKKAYTIRLDTLERIETRALTPQELQQGLFNDKPLAADHGVDSVTLSGNGRSVTLTAVQFDTAAEVIAGQ